jgi:hypothetical protein
MATALTAGECHAHDDAEPQVMAHLVLGETCETRSLAALMISPGWVADNALATGECLRVTRLGDSGEAG